MQKNKRTVPLYICGKNVVYEPASHEDPKNPGVVKKILLRHTDLATGSIQMINWAKLPVGKSFASHFHEDMEEIFIILSGCVKLTIDNESQVIEKQYTVIIPSRAIHTMTNIGNVDAEYIAIGTSQNGSGKTITMNQ